MFFIDFASKTPGECPITQNKASGVHLHCTDIVSVTFLEKRNICGDAGDRTQGFIYTLFHWATTLAVKWKTFSFYCSTDSEVTRKCGRKLKTLMTNQMSKTFVKCSWLAKRKLVLQERIYRLALEFAKSFEKPLDFASLMNSTSEQAPQ